MISVVVSGVKVRRGRELLLQDVPHLRICSRSLVVRPPWHCGTEDDAYSTWQHFSIPCSFLVHMHAHSHTHTSWLCYEEKKPTWGEPLPDLTDPNDDRIRRQPDRHFSSKKMKSRADSEEIAAAGLLQQQSSSPSDSLAAMPLMNKKCDRGKLAVRWLAHDGSVTSPAGPGVGDDDR